MTEPAGEIEELRFSIERVRKLLEGLVVRGLRACGSDELGQLRAFTDEFERAGAAHIASDLSFLHNQVEKGDRRAARALLTAQTSARMLDRLLTLRVARGMYEMAIAAPHEGDDEAEPDEVDDGEGQ